MATSHHLGGLVALAHRAGYERLDTIKQAKLRIVLTANPSGLMIALNSSARSADMTIACSRGKLGKLDRGVVRKVFQERFTANVMARNYLRLYWRLCGAVATADVSDHQAAFAARQEARP